MKSNLLGISLLLLFALTPACAETTASTSTWGDPRPQGNWLMYGQVETVRQTVHRVDGDPAGGAVAGAVIGGILGTVLGGDGFGTLFGAAGGAAIGANASQGHYEERSMEVFVRFDDGSLRPFTFNGYVPFRQGDYVVWTAQGLARR